MLRLIINKKPISSTSHISPISSTSVPLLKSKTKKNSFTYTYYINEKLITDLDTLYRIRKLGIPPGWKDVYLSKDPQSYLQVTGIDIKGKKQYIYHPVFIELTTNEKFDRIKNFCKGLKIFLNKINRVLNNNNSGFRESTICLMFKILYKTYLRIGNYGQSTFGLSTLEKRHIKLISPDTIIFDFIGKKNVRNYKELKDLFIYNRIKMLLNNKKDNDKVFCSLEQTDNTDKHTDKHTNGHTDKHITSIDMNNYIQEHMGPEFSCKDFRTYASNILFIKLLSTGINIKEVYEKVAAELCHTKNIAKKSYITNKIEETYKTRPELFNKKNDPIDIFLMI